MPLRPVLSCSPLFVQSHCNGALTCIDHMRIGLVVPAVEPQVLVVVCDYDGNSFYSPVPAHLNLRNSAAIPQISAEHQARA